MNCVKWGLQRTASQSRLELRANCPSHGSRSWNTFKPLHCVPNPTIAWNTFRSRTCLRISLNVFVGLESCQTHRKPRDKYQQPRNAQESSNSCSYPNTGSKGRFTKSAAERRALWSSLNLFSFKTGFGEIPAWELIQWGSEPFLNERVVLVFYAALGKCWL